MAERPSDSSGLTSGDPLGGGEEPPRHASGLPGVPRGPEEAERTRSAESGGLWSSPEAPASRAPVPAPGYHGGSTPPPGAGGPAPGGHPSPFTGRLVLAGWWRRVGAALIDGVLIGAVAVAIMAPFGIGLFAADRTGSGVVALALGLIFAIVVFAVVALLYAPVMMARTNGKTLGRMAVGTRVVRADGQPMTFGVAAIREIVLKALVVGIANSVLFGIPGLLDVLWPLWDEENRALHDFPVNTRTILD